MKSPKMIAGADARLRINSKPRRLASSETWSRWVLNTVTPRKAAQVHIRSHAVSHEFEPGTSGLSESQNQPESIG